MRSAPIAARHIDNACLLSAAYVMQAAVRGQPYECFIAPETRLPMMNMPDCLRATWELIIAPRSCLRRCTYNLTAMSFTPRQLEASIREHYPDFEVLLLPHHAGFRSTVLHPDATYMLELGCPAQLDGSHKGTRFGTISMCKHCGSHCRHPRHCALASLKPASTP